MKGELRMLKREYSCIYRGGGIFTIKNGLFYEHYETIGDTRSHSCRIKTCVSEYILDLIRVEEYPDNSYLVFNSYFISNSFDDKYRALRLDNDIAEPFIVQIPWKFSCANEDEIYLTSKIVCAHYSSTHNISEKECFTFFLAEQLIDKQKWDEIYIKDIKSSRDFPFEYEYAINLISWINKRNLSKFLAPDKKAYISSDRYVGFISHRTNETVENIYVNLTKLSDIIKIPNSIKMKAKNFRNISRYKTKIYNMLYILGVVTPSPFCEVTKAIKDGNLQTVRISKYIRYTTPVTDTGSMIREDMLRINMNRARCYSYDLNFFIYKDFALTAFKYLLGNYPDLFYCNGLELVVDSALDDSMEFEFDSALAIYINIANIIERVRKDALNKYTAIGSDIQSMAIKNAIIFILIRKLFAFHYYTNEKSLNRIFVKHALNKLAHGFIIKNFDGILNDVYYNFYISDDIMSTIYKYNEYFIDHKIKFVRGSMEYIYAKTLHSLYNTEESSNLSVREFRNLIRRARKTVISIDNNEFVICNRENDSYYSRFSDFMNFIKSDEEFYIFFKMFKFTTSTMKNKCFSAEISNIDSETFYFKICKK